MFLKVLIRNLSACLHDDTSSLRMLRQAIEGLQIMKYFSNKHKLLRLEMLLYELACFSIFHLMLKSTLLSLSCRCHIQLLSSVECFFLRYLKKFLWLVNLVLMVLKVRLTQVSSGLLSLAQVTVA